MLRTAWWRWRMSNALLGAEARALDGSTRGTPTPTPHSTHSIHSTPAVPAAASGFSGVSTDLPGVSTPRARAIDGSSAAQALGSDQNRTPLLMQVLGSPTNNTKQGANSTERASGAQTASGASGASGGRVGIMDTSVSARLMAERLAGGGGGGGGSGGESKGEDEEVDEVRLWATAINTTIANHHCAPVSSCTYVTLLHHPPFSIPHSLLFLSPPHPPLTTNRPTVGGGGQYTIGFQGRR